MNITDLHLLFIELSTNPSKTNAKYIRDKLSDVRSILQEPLIPVIDNVVNNVNPLIKIKEYVVLFNKEQDLIASYKRDEYAGFVVVNYTSTPFRLKIEGVKDMETEMDAIDVLLKEMDIDTRPVYVEFFKEQGYSGTRYKVE